MIQYIDFSPGQVKILSRVCEIYNENLGEVYRNLNIKGPSVIESEVMDSLGIKLDNLYHHMEEDIVKFSEVMDNPQYVVKLTTLEIIICGFIIKEWQSDENWNDLEVANLLNKLMVLTELQTNKNQISLS